MTQQFKRCSFLALLGIAAVALPGLSQDSSGKGKITVGVHEVEMKAGNVYQIKIEAKGFSPRVNMTPGFLRFTQQDFKKPNSYMNFYIPNKDEKNTILVAPEIFGLTGKGPFEYEFDFKAMTIAAMPILDVKAELTNADPPFKADFANRARHKNYKFNVKAGQFYQIDMKEPAQGRLDSYLYLLDSKGKIIASDDDGGGFPSARIFFHAPVDGEYNIIATGLGDALGQFVLTVRSTEKK